MIRDEPNITLATVTADEVTNRNLTVAVGSRPNDLVAAAAVGLAVLDGVARVEGPAGGHEVYLSDRSVLTTIVTGASA